MEAFSLKIGEQLREIRAARNLTLEETARLTGVSKPMLGQIERGQSSPTINTLWKIATGLKIPLSFFCREEQTEYTVAAIDPQKQITEEGGRMRAYPLFPYDPIRSIEAFCIEFDGGVEHRSEPHAPGVEEYLFLVEGTLELSLSSCPVFLSERQSVRFRADVPHVYKNPSDRRCTVYNIIFYSGA